MDLIAGNPEIREKVKKAWAVIDENMEEKAPNQRWRCVKGIISAVIVTLKDLSWKTQGPWSWTTPKGQQLAINEEEL